MTISNLVMVFVFQGQKEFRPMDSYGSHRLQFKKEKYVCILLVWSHPSIRKMKQFSLTRNDHVLSPNCHLLARAACMLCAQDQLERKR